MVTLKLINLVNFTPANEGENPCSRRYKTTTKFNQAVGVFLNPRLPNYEAQLLTTQSWPFNLRLFYETDTGSALTGHKAIRVEAKSLRVCKVIFLLFFAT